MMINTFLCLPSFYHFSVTKKVQTAKLKNELRGLGLAVAIGTGVGVTIGFISTIAQLGITSDALKLAMIEGIKNGIMNWTISSSTFTKIR